jgi:flagellar biogenesis protein FliO
MAGGRPTDYSSEMLQKTLDYAHQEHVVIPKIEELVLVLGVNKSTIYLWSQEHKEFSDALDIIRAKQACKVLDRSLVGEYNPTIAKLILGNNHGYSDRIQQDHTSSDGSMSPKSASDDDIDARIKELLKGDADES